MEFDEFNESYVNLDYRIKGSDERETITGRVVKIKEDLKGNITVHLDQIVEPCSDGKIALIQRDTKKYFLKGEIRGIDRIKKEDAQQHCENCNKLIEQIPSNIFHTKGEIYKNTLIGFKPQNTQ